MAGRCKNMRSLNNFGEMDQALGAQYKANNGKNGEVEYII
jgi:hypothetical protein